MFIMWCIMLFMSIKNREIDDDGCAMKWRYFEYGTYAMECKEVLVKEPGIGEMFFLFSESVLVSGQKY